MTLSVSSVICLLCSPKLKFLNTPKAFDIAVPIAPKNAIIPSKNDLRTPTTLCINLNNPLIFSIIIGKLFTAQPSKTIPKKSNNLPRNPLVLLVTIFPSFFATPVTDDASNSSSRSFLLTFSLLFAKNSPSFLIRVLLNKFLSFVCLTISSDFCFALDIPFVKELTVFLIESILIDDLRSEFLLELIDIFYTPYVAVANKV